MTDREKLIERLKAAHESVRYCLDLTSGEEYAIAEAIKALSDQGPRKATLPEGYSLKVDGSIVTIVHNDEEIAAFAGPDFAEHRDEPAVRDFLSAFLDTDKADAVSSVEPVKAASDTAGERIASFADLKPGWDSYNGQAITEPARFVAAAMLTPPVPVPMSNGGIQLEWNTGQSNIEVAIDPWGGIEGSWGYNGRATPAPAVTSEPLDSQIGADETKGHLRDWVDEHPEHLVTRSELEVWLNRYISSATKQGDSNG